MQTKYLKGNTSAPAQITGTLFDNNEGNEIMAAPTPCVLPLSVLRVVILCHVVSGISVLCVVELVRHSNMAAGYLVVFLMP